MQGPVCPVRQKSLLSSGGEKSQGTEGAITASNVLSEGRFAVLSAASVWGGRALSSRGGSCVLLAAGAFPSQPAKLLLLLEDCYLTNWLPDQPHCWANSQVCSLKRFIAPFAAQLFLVKV